MAKKDKTLLYGALAIGAYLLLTSNKGNAQSQPQCPPGYYYNGSVCVRIPTQNQNTGGGSSGGGSSGGGGFWNSNFWNSLPGMIDSVSNIFTNTTPINPNTGVGRYYY